MDKHILNAPRGPRLDDTAAGFEGNFKVADLQTLPEADSGTAFSSRNNAPLVPLSGGTEQKGYWSLRFNHSMNPDSTLLKAHAARSAPSYISFFMAWAQKHDFDHSGQGEKPAAQEVQNCRHYPIRPITLSFFTSVFT